MTIYISFGTSHRHTVNGKDFNFRTLCSIQCKDHNEGRDKAFEVFGDKFCTSYETIPKVMQHLKIVSLDEQLV